MRLEALADPVQTFSDQYAPGYSTPPPPTKEESTLKVLQEELAAHAGLVRAGCRVPCPDDMLESFIRNPEHYLDDPAYHDIILFYRIQDLGKDRRTAFCKGQLRRWNRFRKVQHMIRERNVKDETTLIWAGDYDTWEAYVSRWAPQEGPLEGQWGFSNYADTMKERFARYGFTRSCLLQIDLSQQDRLTTWLEYLGFEYSYYDPEAYDVEAIQQRRDRIWDKLVKSSVLEPGATPENFHETIDQSAAIDEEESAKRAVQSATTALRQAEKVPSHLRGSPNLQQTHRTRLLAAQSVLDMAKLTFESTQRRNRLFRNFLRLTASYCRAQANVERWGHLLRWIEQQIPAIERDMKSPANDDIDKGKRLEVTKPQDNGQSRQSERQSEGTGTSGALFVQKALTGCTLQQEGREDGERVKRRRCSGDGLTDEDGTAKRSKKASEDDPDDSLPKGSLV